MSAKPAPMEVEEEEDDNVQEQARKAAPPAQTQQSSNSNSSTSLPWVEKYRPSSLDELIAHEEIISTLRHLLETRRLPHLLLYGPPGTGKTSTIMALAKTLYGPKQYGNFVMELNASDDRGIDVVRQQIKDFASMRKIFSTGFKLIILDEADQMTNDAQAALRRIIEKYSRNTRFCLVCNYVNKIIPALQSRCTRFRFAPLKRNQITQRLSDIAHTESVNLAPDALDAIIRLAEGDMRKCLNILQSAHLSSPKCVDAETVYRCTGNPTPEDVRNIVTWMINESITTASQMITNLKSAKGLALQDILRDTHLYVQRMDFPVDIKIFLLDKLADVEYRAAMGASEKIQLSSLIALFQLAREAVHPDTTRTIAELAQFGAVAGAAC